tara:strand:- start:698 stop:889 length:192 start_codon:yes stop_codon:yes gene_type:complete
MNVDFSKISNVVLDGIDHLDHPDYCDAYITSCDIDGVEATESELDEINDNSEFVNESVFNYLY